MILRACACALLASAIIGFALPASADSLQRTDPSRDVVSYQGMNAGETALAPTQANGDIVGSRITYSGRSLRIRISYRDLRRVGASLALAAIQTPQTRFYVELVTRPGHYSGRARFADISDAAIPCARLKADIDYVENVESIDVPRSCLHRPTWVRVGINNATSIDGFNTVYGDDAGTGGAIGTGDPVLSRRILHSP